MKKKNLKMKILNDVVQVHATQSIILVFLSRPSRNFRVFRAPEVFLKHYKHY
jgi:hypothetical protein